MYSISFYNEDSGFNMITNPGKNPINQDRYPISVWRVCLPSDIDREVYIKKCYLTGTISVIDEFAERQDNVKVGQLALQCIKFPNNEDEVGSEVVCASAPYGGKLYVIDVYQGEDFVDQNENQYRLFKAHQGGYSEVRIDGRGNVMITVDSESQSTISIIGTGQNKNSQLNVNIQGSANIKVSEQIVFESKSISLNKDGEPILLGNKTTDLIKSILDQLSKESAGPYPLLGQSVYKELINNLDELKSKLSSVK